jgi:outer membrane receptor protein involved in Fe transport
MRICFAAIVLAIASPAYADVRATVVDGQTMAPIAGAVIRELPDGQVEVSAPGYESQTVDPSGGLILLFKPHALDEVIAVHGQAPRAATEASEVLTRDEIRNLPGGGGDALAGVRSLPGVAATPPTTAGRLVIRGGAPQDSRLTIDGVPVPFVYHAFDNTTILPVSMIGAIAYSPGGFGVDEGRATSGTVAIATADDPPVRAGGQVSLSLLDASAIGAVPISKDHGVYLSGGVRRSTVDLLIPFAMPESLMVGFTTPPRYYDGQLRLDWIAGAHDRFALLALTSYDRLGVVNHMMNTDLPADFAQDSKFGRLVATWKHDDGVVKNRLVGALGDGDFHATFDTIQHVDDHNELAMLRDDLAIAVHPRLRIRAGVESELELHDLDARSIILPADGLPPGHFDDLPIKTIATTYDANYAAAYAAADVMPTATTTLTAGARVDYFTHIHAAVFEPRAEVSQKAGAMTLRASIGSYARDHDQTQAIPTDLAPERATQITGGTEIDLGDGLAASATVYYTKRRDLAVDDPTRSDDLPYAATGVGRSVGSDLLLRLHRDRLFGWIGYSFGRTTRRDFPDTAWHPTAFDQTHILTAVGSYQAGAWRLGARFQYARGLPYTPVVGGMYDNELGRYLPILGTPYGSRYPDSAQVDVKLERVWKRKELTIAAFVDIANVFRDARVLRYTYSDDFSSREPLTEYVPLPSIGVRGEL